MYTVSRGQLLEICRLVYDRHLTNAAVSNFSGRASTDTVYLTLTGNVKRTRLRMKPDDLLLVDMNGTISPISAAWDWECRSGRAHAGARSFRPPISASGAFHGGRRADLGRGLPSPGVLNKLLVAIGLGLWATGWLGESDTALPAVKVDGANAWQRLYKEAFMEVHVAYDTAMAMVLTFISLVVSVVIAVVMLSAPPTKNRLAGWPDTTVDVEKSFFARRKEDLYAQGICGHCT